MRFYRLALTRILSFVVLLALCSPSIAVLTPLNGYVSGNGTISNSNGSLLRTVDIWGAEWDEDFAEVHANLKLTLEGDNTYLNSPLAHELDIKCTPTNHTNCRSTGNETSERWYSTNSGNTVTVLGYAKLQVPTSSPDWWYTGKVKLSTSNHYIEFKARKSWGYKLFWKVWKNGSVQSSGTTNGSTNNGVWTVTKNVTFQQVVGSTLKLRCENKLEKFYPNYNKSALFRVQGYISD